MKTDLLLEIGTEDLPARYVWPLAEALAKGIAGGLARRSLASGAHRTFATPRRIAVHLAEVEDRQADQAIERRGPTLASAYKDGQPTQAALGFAKSCGVALDKLEKLETGKGSWLVFRSAQKGRKTAELIPEIFEETLKSMDDLVPKRMRWGSGEETFVRPVQWLVCMLDNKVIPLKRFGLTAGNKTYGHRFHAPKAIALKSPAEYEKKLKAARVWADFESRKAEIWKQIEAEAKQLKGTPHHNDELLDEVTALVEWPVTIHGRMEERFMRLPPEVIIATIEHNQRYFPVFGKNGKLLPFFITASNIKSKDVKQVIAGNERVVTPRLSDALFFWEQDLKRPLAAYGARLGSVAYQKELGSVADKVARIKQLAIEISRQVPSPPVGEGQGAGLSRAHTPPLSPLPQGEGKFIDEVERAAQLCKNDLVTRMVYEFPELQGVMGGYYAEKSGETVLVAQAIKEHYLPTQQGAPIPSTRGGQILALADKLDTLAGIFAIGQKPTASKDPFALRRAALGVLRICIEGRLPLDLGALLKIALEIQPAGKRDHATLNELLGFVMERLRGWLAEQGVAVEVFNAVATTGTTAPLDFVSRVRAVEAFEKLQESAQLSAAHKRIRNILKQAGEGGIEVKTALLKEAAEHHLHEALLKLDGQVQQAARTADYTAGLKKLAQLQAPVDVFFDKVMVMTEDAALRANRLALLRKLDRLCRSIADISCLPG